jgi:hypothetical protein
MCVSIVVDNFLNLAGWDFEPQVGLLLLLRKPSQGLDDLLLELVFVQHHRALLFQMPQAENIQQRVVLDNCFLPEDLSISAID